MPEPTPHSLSATTAQTAEASTDTPIDGCYLGFDFGLKRIGIASGNTMTGTAMPVSTVSNSHGIPDWHSIDSIIREWQPVGLVVGRPVHLDGAIQEMTNHATGFTRQLRRRFTLPVFMVDERLSSVEAIAVTLKKRQSGAKGRAKKQDIDKIAAAILLQRWLAIQ